MSHPIYDEALTVIGHAIETSAFVFVSDREGNTAFLYNKIHDETYNVMGQLLSKGNRAVALLKGDYSA